MNIQSYSQLEADLRIDAEFFLKKSSYSRALTSQLNTKRLSEIADVADGDHAKFPDSPDGTVRYLQAQDFDGFVEPIGETYVTKDYFLKNLRSKIEANNVLFSIMGTVGQVGLTPKDFEPCMANRAVGIIRPKEGVSASVIFAYLGSSIGRSTILGYSNGGVQQRINLDLLRSTPIPQFSSTFEISLENIINQAFIKKEFSLMNEKSANNTIIESLGLKDWQPPEPLSYTRLASDVSKAGRLDAEHFQPKYHEMLDIAAHNAARVRRVNEFSIHCDRGEQPAYDSEGTLAVVNSRHILENGLDYDGFERTHDRYWDEPRFISSRIYPNDILTYTTGAKVGRTAAYLDNAKALASNHVNLLRIENENPLYVAAVMNSMIGRWQTRMKVTGSAQVELYPADIRSFEIPFVDGDTENKIVDLTKTAHAARRKAKAMLENAKLSIEIAIEKSEDDAIQFLASALEG